MVAPAYGWLTVEVDELIHGMNVLLVPMTYGPMNGAYGFTTIINVPLGEELKILVVLLYTFASGITVSRGAGLKSYMGTCDKSDSK